MRFAPQPIVPPPRRRCRAGSAAPSPSTVFGCCRWLSSRAHCKCYRLMLLTALFNCSLLLLPVGKSDEKNALPPPPPERFKTHQSPCPRAPAPVTRPTTPAAMPRAQDQVAAARSAPAAVEPLTLRGPPIAEARRRAEGEALFRPRAGARRISRRSRRSRRSTPSSPRRRTARSRWRRLRTRGWRRARAGRSKASRSRSRICSAPRAC